MKRTISILMIIMMLLTTGAFASYAEVNGNEGNDQITSTDGTTDGAELNANGTGSTDIDSTEDPAVDTPAAPAEEPAENPAEEPTEDPADELTEAPADGLAEDSTENFVLEKGLSRAVTQQFIVSVDNNKNGTVSISWDAIEGAVYNVYLNGTLEGSGEGISACSYTFKNLAAGEYTINVDAFVDESLVAQGTTADSTVTVEDWIAAPRLVNAHHGYDSVSLYWEQVEGATEYIICKSVENKAASKFDPQSPYIRAAASKYKLVKFSKTDANAQHYTTGADFYRYEYHDANAGKATYYRIYAVNQNGVISDGSPIVGSVEVRPIAYYVTLKTAKKLKSHDGKNKTLSLKKGTRVRCTGFGGGRYKFYDSRGYYFYINAISTKNASAEYTKSFNYSTITAENYVNRRGLSSSTKYLIWTSQYCQHTYVFYGSRGKWRCIRHFECGTGAAKAPSPSGSDKELIVGKGTEKNPGRKAKRHSRKWWSPYSNWNSYHTKLAKQTLGYPASKGCIRLMEADAYYIYNLPRHTRVVVV